MRIFGWRKELESGIEQIDAQHKQLIETANSLIIRSKFGNDISDISDCLSYLEKYVQYHFQSEEAFQSTSGYPKYKIHKALHQSVATQLKFIMVKLESSNYETKDIEDFYTFFISAIVNHILVEDLEFSIYYKEHLSNLDSSS